MDLERETDIDQLRRIAVVQQRQIQQLLQTLSRKCAELEHLKGGENELQTTLALLERQHAQVQRELERQAEREASRAKPAEQVEKKKRAGHGPTEQPELERTTEVFELDEADRVCPACGGELRALDGQYETAELVDVIEVRYRVIEAQRQKYVCDCGGCVETAPGPERLIDGGRYSFEFAAKVAADKYVDHLPLARQSRIMARHGLKVTTQTLWDQLWALGNVLRPAYDELYRKVLAEPVVGLDQTSRKRLEATKATPWQMWCLTTEQIVFHSIRDDKSARTFAELVGNYEGTIVCDALSTHGAGAREGPGITLAGCWAHVLRKFAEAEKDHPDAAVALEMIRKLYEIDGRAGSLKERGELRRTESAAVLDELRSWLEAQPVLKSTTVGDATRYTLTYWSRLVRFVEDARIPLDNNRTERGIRGPVVGRKNHFGSKSRRGTEVASVLYSLVETAKLNGIDPAKYLAEAARAARRGEVQLPLKTG